MLPPVIPVFPLPNVVLFPGVFLPLHIFEPRYRAMTRDALAGDRIIGISCCRPGFEADYERRPAGLPGRMCRRDLPFGAARRRPVQRRHQRLVEIPGSRRARRRRIPPGPRRDTAASRLAGRTRDARTLAAAAGDGARRRAESRRRCKSPTRSSDVDLVHALCQYLQFSPAERQALLECEAASSRCARPHRSARDAGPPRPAPRRRLDGRALTGTGACIGLEARLPSPLAVHRHPWRQDRTAPDAAPLSGVLAPALAAPQSPARAVRRGSGRSR